MKKILINTSQIINKYHISYQTVNYYTSLGFFVVAKTNGNKRLYEEKNIRAALEKIKELRTKGYPLKIIREEFVNINRNYT